MRRSLPGRFALTLTVALCAVLAGGASRIVQDQCGPFTDVTPGFCPYILEVYYLGITVGTSATTFSPDEPLTRGQGAVFVAKGINQALARSSRRAALGQWWTTTPQWDLGLGVTAVGSSPSGIEADGADIWVANHDDGTISRVRASDGKLLETWTGTLGAFQPRSAMGRIFAAGLGGLYMIDPTQTPGPVQIMTEPFTVPPSSLAFDGSRIWIANSDGSVTIVTPGSSVPWTSTTVQSAPNDATGIVFDGSNMWVTDLGSGTLIGLDSAGGALQTVPVGGTPSSPIFDGTNIWVPTGLGNTIQVVQASSGTVVATLSLGGTPTSIAFDGQRVLVGTSELSALFLWRAADLAPLGSFTLLPPGFPNAIGSDGINFWVSFSTGNLARF